MKYNAGKVRRTVPAQNMGESYLKAPLCRPDRKCV